MPDYMVGLDLAQVSDYTALAVVRRSLLLDQDGLPMRSTMGDTLHRFDVNHLERFQRGTPYPAIVNAVSALMRRPELGRTPRLVIDATGVGRPVVDLFINARIGVRLLPVTIVGGRQVTMGGWGVPGVLAYHTPKLELASAVQAGLCSGRLKIASRLKMADVLKKELLDFQVKVTASANEQYGTWREGAHDDLVLAVALAVWMGGRREHPLEVERDEETGLATGPGRDETALQTEWDQEQEREQKALEAERHKEAAEKELAWNNAENPFWWGGVSDDD